MISSQPIALLAICMVMISSVVSTDGNNSNPAAYVSGDPSPAIAKLLVGPVGSIADFAAQRLRCPMCDDFGKSNLGGLQLEETCSPANDPLDVPTTASFFSEPLNFTLDPGQYAEVTTINPSSGGTSKSCLKDSCQAKLKYSFYYADMVGRRRNMDGSLFNFADINTQSVFTDDAPTDSCKPFDADGVSVRKANHWCFVGGISDRPRRFFAAVESVGSCSNGMKLRVKKHTHVDVKNTNNIKNQGVQCVDLTSSSGLDGGTMQAGSTTSPFINVTQMYRRKWPNASNIRWWVQSKAVTTGSQITVGDQCDGDMTKDNCVKIKTGETKKSFCNFTFSSTSFPENFYRPGQLIGFKEPYKCTAPQPNPGTTDCTKDGCQKYWGEMTTFFGESDTTQVDDTVTSPVSVFSTIKVLETGRNAGSSWFTVETATKFQGKQGWTTHQVCPSDGTSIVHVPTQLEADWYGTAPATRSLTDLKIVHSGASTAGSLPAGAVVKEWTVNDAASEGPYLQMYRGTGAYDTKTLKFYDDANVAKSFFGDYSVAHVDCGLMPCPTSNLQICSRIICPSGTKLDDSGNCVLCPTSAAGNTFSTRTMNPFQGAYYTVDTVACDACADYGMNNEGEVVAGADDFLIKYNKGIVVEGPEYANDPTKRTTCAQTSCSTGSFRSLITKNVGECTICGKGKYRGGTTAKIETEDLEMKTNWPVASSEIELKFARNGDKRMYVAAATPSVASKKEPSSGFFPPLGTCKGVDTNDDSTCGTKTASKGVCLDDIGTCAAAGVNAACSTPTTKVTCLDAGTVTQGDCVYTSKCMYTDPVNTGKIRLLPADVPTIPVDLASSAISADDKLYRFEDDASFLEVGDKFKVNRPQCIAPSGAAFNYGTTYTSEVSCVTKGVYKDVCIDSGGTSKPYENGRQGDQTVCTAAAATWNAAGKCYKAKVGSAPTFTVPLNDGREEYKADCEAPAGVWTTTASTCSNGMYTSQDACENKGVWVYCTDARFTSDAACSRAGTWVPGKCVSASDCTLLLIAGRETSSHCSSAPGTWSDKKLETEYTVANGMCYNQNDEEPSMNGKEARKTYGRVCETSYTWTELGKCYEYIAPDGVATDELSDGRVGKSSCEAPAGVWTPADSTTTPSTPASCSVGSVGLYSTRKSCTTKGTWSQCDNNNFGDQGGCDLTAPDPLCTAVGALGGLCKIANKCEVKATGTNSACAAAAASQAACLAVSDGGVSANGCEFKSGRKSTPPFTWYGFGNPLDNTCSVKPGGLNNGCKGKTTLADCTAVPDGGVSANECVFTPAKSAALLIPLTTNYVDTDVNTCTGSGTNCGVSKRNLWYTADVRYGYYGTDSCESCPSGLSAWSLDPSDHDTLADCQTCPKGYVGLSTAVSCTTCDVGKFDSRTSSQQTRAGYQSCSGLTGDDACDSSKAENCATCPLGKSTFAKLLALENKKSPTFSGTKDDCEYCPTGYHYSVPSTDAASSNMPIWDSGSCSTCPKSTYRPLSTGTSYYRLISSGTCSTTRGMADITSIGECGTAATSLGLADTTAASDGQTGVDFDPIGCYYEGNQLKWNDNGNTGLCTSADECLCKGRVIADILDLGCTSCPHGWGHTDEDLLLSSRVVMLSSRTSACLDKKSTTCPPGQVGVVTYAGGECAAKDVVKSTADSSNCTTCPPNTYTFGDQRACFSCPAGKVIPADVDFNPAFGGNTSFVDSFWTPNSAHHFSAEACAVDVEASPPGICPSVGPRAQEYDLGFNQVGEHWITFLQDPKHALQLGTCCVGPDCETSDGATDMSREQQDFMLKGYKGEWQVVSENSQQFPTVDSTTKWESTTIRRSPAQCLFPYDDCNKGVANAYRNDLINGLIPKSSDGIAHRMWAKFKCLDPLGCAKIGTSKINNKQMPEKPANFIASDSTNKIMRYKIASVGCLPGEGLQSGGNCTTCPVGTVSPYVGPALDSDAGTSGAPATCAACPAGKTLPEGAALPNFDGIELLECAFHLEGKTSDGNTSSYKCQHVGYEQPSEVFSVTQEVGEVIYLGTRFCGANRCTQFMTRTACEIPTRPVKNAFKYQRASSQCRWSLLTNQCVAALKSKLVMSEISSPPKKIRDRSTLNYIRKLQRYDGDGEFYQEADGISGSPASMKWPDSFQDPSNVQNLGFEYVMKLEAVQYRRNVFVQSFCMDPLGCPGLRVSVEARGCASGSYGTAPNCQVCPANTYGTAGLPAPVGLSVDKVCTACPAGKSISALALPAQRASACACQTGWPMESPAVSSTMAGWCSTAVLRAKNVLPMQFKLPNRTWDKTKQITYTAFQIVQRAGTILRFTPIETILPPREQPEEPKPTYTNWNKQSGRPVSLSADGTTVAIGAPNNDNGAGMVRVYHVNSEGNWTQVGQDIEGEPKDANDEVKPVQVRYDQEPNCGKPPIPQDYSHQLKSLKMWAGDIMSVDGAADSGSTQNSLKCMPRAHNVDFEVQGSRSNRAEDDPLTSTPLPDSNADTNSVPGVLTVGSSCQDRVVYFHAEASDCYGKHHDSDGCEVIIEVTEEVVDKCITDRTTRNATVAAKSYVPVLGTYDITVNATIYARCVSEYRIGTLMQEQLKKTILESFTDRKTTGQRCIGSGAACLVDQQNRFDGVNGIRVEFNTDMNQTIELPDFCDPDAMYAPVTSDEMFRRTPSSYDVIKGGPGLRDRPPATLLSPRAYEMWGAFQNVSHQAVSNFQEGARRRMEAVGEYALDWHDYMQNGADDVGAMRAAYHGEDYPTTATTNRGHVARRESRQLQQREQRRLSGTSSAVHAPASQEPVEIGKYVDPNMRPAFGPPSNSRQNNHLFSAVSLTFTVRNVRAANKKWAEALVKDILGAQEIPKNNARPKYVVTKTSSWWEPDNNMNIDDGVYNLPRFTETPCTVAANMARVLKSTNSMRPTFRWASVTLHIDNTENTYVDCGFSPVEIFFIVVGSLLAFFLLCSLIFNFGCRKRGACGGDPDASCISCYGGFGCCSMLPCCFCCPCQTDGSQTKRSPKASKKQSPASKPAAPPSPAKQAIEVRAPMKAKNEEGQNKPPASEIAMSAVPRPKRNSNIMTPAGEPPKKSKRSSKVNKPTASESSGLNPARASFTAAALEADIAIHTDQKSGKKYSYNSKTKETKWLD